MSAEPLTSVEAVPAAEETSAVRRNSWWLFSPRVDVCVFGGSALVSLLLLWVGARAGVLESESPEWAWVPADVADMTLSSTTLADQCIERLRAAHAECARAR